MSDMEVIECFNNAWRAMAKHYIDSPDEVMRNAMNLIAKIIGKVESQVKASHEVKQMTVDEWIELLNMSIEEDW